MLEKRPKGGKIIIKKTKFLHIPSFSHLPLHNEAHLPAVIKGIVELKEARVLQRAHNVHLALHVLPVLGAGGFDELRRQALV